MNAAICSQLASSRASCFRPWDALYLRAYNGENSRGCKAVMRQKAGRITVAGVVKEVAFEPVDGPINDLMMMPTVPSTGVADTWDRGLSAGPRRRRQGLPYRRQVSIIR